MSTDGSDRNVGQSSWMGARLNPSNSSRNTMSIDIRMKKKILRRQCLNHQHLLKTQGIYIIQCLTILPTRARGKQQDLRILLTTPEMKLRRCRLEIMLNMFMKTFQLSLRESMRSG